MRILVAEDAKDMRDLLVLTLSEAGWEVFAAKDGRDALRVYHNAIEDDRYFDVLLLDVEMPRLNGIAVGVVVRRFEQWSEIPRAKHIYFTGYDDVVPPEELLDAEFAGTKFANEYLRKPINTYELIEKIQEVVKKEASA